MTTEISIAHAAAQRALNERVIASIETAAAFSSGTQAEIMRAVRRRNGVWVRLYGAMERLSRVTSLEYAVQMMEMRYAVL